MALGAGVAAVTRSDALAGTWTATVMSRLPAHPQRARSWARKRSTRVSV